MKKNSKGKGSGKFTGFIGRQLARLKMGQNYYMIIISTITALGIVNIAFPEIDTWVIFALFPIALLSAFFVGYFMDKSNITATDHMKTLEMTSRYINTADLKSYEFWLVIMEVIFKWMTSIQDGNPLNRDEIRKEYIKFLKKWSPKVEE